MSLLAALLVAKPLNILVVGVLFLAAYFASRRSAFRLAVPNPRPLLIASVAWGLYAGWECLVQLATPEANIRVDLLVLWPMLAVLSAWAVFRTLRPRGAAKRQRSSGG